MSRAIPLPNGKSIVKGDARDTVDEFEAEYGEEAGDWLRAVLNSTDNADLINTIYSRVKTEDSLQVHLGPYAAQVVVTPPSRGNQPLVATGTIPNNYQKRW